MLKKIGTQTILAVLVACAMVPVALAKAGPLGLRESGSVPVKLTLQNGQEKLIRLIKIKLSDKAKAQVTHRVKMALLQPASMGANSNALPAQAFVGMNGLPVLDQGQWGSCATFATTGAIDALYSLSGDQAISQLCNLQLGRTLNQLPGADGGWDGSFGYLVLGQINDYGYLTKQYQRQQGCGGLTEYPVEGGNNGQAMSEASFRAASVKDFMTNDWHTLLKTGDFAPTGASDNERALQDIKSALLAGHRVVFGTILDPYVGQAGAVGAYQGVGDDTWVLTDAIEAAIQAGDIAGHEIIIDGYDDNACASYQKAGVTAEQCGLLRIRNSWGPDAGVHGDYYMSYAYFKGMAMEAYAMGSQ